MKCPQCASELKQHKVGKNPSGSQRYQCYLCKCKYTPEKKPHSYGAEIRQKAVQMYVDGLNLRRIAGQLGVNHQSVANWAKTHANGLPVAPVPDEVENAEIKRQDLHHHHRRPQNALYFGLGGCLGTYPGGHPTHG